MNEAPVIKIRKFEFCYFFYMVILMSFMTPETRMLPGGLSHPLAWSIQFIWTFIIVIRNNISFYNKNFAILLTICCLWSLIQIIAKAEYELRHIGLYFSFIYSIILAFIHINVYKKKLFLLYERCMVIMCKIAIPLWLFSNLFPTLSASVTRLFPSTGYGRNILWLYNWMDPSLGQVQGFFTRNAGCSWEPGRFAVMVCLAIAINLLYRKITFEKNNNIKWLIAALLTTFSTTGYIVTACLYIISALKKRKIETYLFVAFLGIVLFFLSLNISFIGEKIKTQSDINTQIEIADQTESWYESENRYLALNRFPSIYYEIDNFMHDPYIGYGKDVSKSLFGKTYSIYYSTTGGLIQMISVYGAFLGLFFYYILYKSSRRIARDFFSKKESLIFFFFLLSLVSYPLFEFAIFMPIWLYDFLRS